MNLIFLTAPTHSRLAAAVLTGLLILVMGISTLSHCRQAKLPKRVSPAIFKQAVAAYRRHEYAEAERIWRQALDIEKRLSPDASSDIEVWNEEMWLAISLMEHGDYAEAEDLLTEAVAISQKIRTPGYHKVPQSLQRLAGLYLLERRYPEAERMFTASLWAAEQLDQNGAAVAIALTDLVDFYKLEGRYSEAEPLYKRLLQVRSRALVPISAPSQFERMLVQ